MEKRDQILDALAAFARQGPGLEPGNYISGGCDTEGRRAYRQESRAITRDLHDFRALWAAVRWRDSITESSLRRGFEAYSGRLQLAERDNGVELHYCTGQYFPTEYRKAACAVLGSVLFYYFRACLEEGKKLDGKNDGDKIRAYARRELGHRLARRWVD